MCQERRSGGWYLHFTSHHPLSDYILSTVQTPGRQMSTSGKSHLNSLGKSLDLSIHKGAWAHPIKTSPHLEASPYEPSLSKCIERDCTCIEIHLIWELENYLTLILLWLTVGCSIERKKQLRADLTLQRLIFQIERKMTTFIIENHIRLVTTHQEGFYNLPDATVRIFLGKIWRNPSTHQNRFCEFWQNFSSRAFRNMSNKILDYIIYVCTILFPNNDIQTSLFGNW